MLLLGNIGGIGTVANLQIGQGRADCFGFVIPAFLVNSDKAGETQVLMAGAEGVAGALGVNGYGVEQSICHLGSKETAPNQLIELILFLGQAVADSLRV